MNRLKYLGFSLLLVLIGMSFSGCAGDAVQIGPNKFTNTSYDKGMAYLKADSTCGRMGLVMKPLSQRDVGMDYAITFTCIEEPTHTENCLSCE